MLAASGPPGGHLPVLAAGAGGRHSSWSADGALRPDGAELYPPFLLGLMRTVVFQQLARAPFPAGQARAMVELFLHGAGSRP